MTTDLQIFSSTEFGTIRSLLIDDAPWFVGKDVATALGYSDTFGALKKHVDPEDKQNCQNGSFKTSRGMTLINESGLYSLILSSKLPSAKKFKRWVTSEVLPAIRRTGSYTSTAEVEDEPEMLEQRASTIDDYLRAASILAGCRNERLPYVLCLLEQGGFQIPEVTQISVGAHRENLLREEGLIREFLEREVPSDWAKWSLEQRRMYWGGGMLPDDIELVERDRVCALEIWCELFNGSPKEMKNADAREINAILAKIPGYARAEKKCAMAHMPCSAVSSDWLSPDSL